MIEKVCIIGAGSSGITTAKALKERGIPYDCFELGSGIGGNWRYQNDNGRPSAYKSLHIDTSKERMAFADFPFPDDVPTFPHHTHVLQYFEDYVDHFDLRDTITFNTCVEHVQPLPDGAYEVRLQGGEIRRYRAVIVCNGHHWNPRWPQPPFPGTFTGEEMHSHDYRVPDAMRDKRVVVVGIGNSGVDIACELSHVAESVALSTRRGAHIVPKYVLGRPADQWVTPLSSRLPLWMQRLSMRLLLFLARGSQKSYGVPEPATPFLSQHPTMNSEILHYVGQGRVAIKPDIAAFDGQIVRFEDGSQFEADLILYATGYRITFPFLDPDILDPQDNEISLYQLVVHPDYDGLYFVGLCQPLGAIMPLAEQQALWLADLLNGEAALPHKAAMRYEIDQRKRAMRARYDHSPRHTIQVDFWPYMRDLERERRQGRQRLKATTV